MSASLGPVSTNDAKVPVQVPRSAELYTDMFPDHLALDGVEGSRQIKRIEEARDSFVDRIRQFDMPAIRSDCPKCRVTRRCVDGNTCCHLEYRRDKIFRGWCESWRSANSLAMIDLKFNVCSRGDISTLAQTLGESTCKSRSLDMSFNSHMVPRDMQILSSCIRSNRSLTAVSFANNLNVGESGVIALSRGLESNTIVNYLNIERTNAGDRGLTAVGRMLKTNRSLIVCRAGGNNITSAGIEEVAKALGQNISLTSLSLDNNDIDNHGAAHLAKYLKSNCTLTALDLHRNCLGSEGLRILSEDLLTLNSTLLNVDVASDRKVNKDTQYQVHHPEILEDNPSSKRLPFKFDDEILIGTAVGENRVFSQLFCVAMQFIDHLLMKSYISARDTRMEVQEAYANLNHYLGPLNPAFVQYSSRRADSLAFLKTLLLRLEKANNLLLLHAGECDRKSLKLDTHGWSLQYQIHPLATFFRSMNLSAGEPPQLKDLSKLVKETQLARNDICMWFYKEFAKLDRKLSRLAAQEIKVWMQKVNEEETFLCQLKALLPSAGEREQKVELAVPIPDIVEKKSDEIARRTLNMAGWSDRVTKNDLKEGQENETLVIKEEGKEADNNDCDPNGYGYDNDDEYWEEEDPEYYVGRIDGDWELFFDEDSQMWYWYNHLTEEAQWCE